MRTLFHFWLSPSSRKVRIALGEKGLDFEMQVEKISDRRPEFLAMNPAGDSSGSGRTGRRPHLGRS